MEAVRLYMAIPFIYEVIKSISIFSYKVILPFLNLCEKGGQKDFVNLLPVLYQDLIIGELETLNEYHVDYSFDVPAEDTEVQEKLLQTFSRKVADCLLEQKGREYGLVLDPPRATQLHLLSDDQLLQLPTTNIISERHLAIFDREMTAFGRTPNSNFRAKGK